jgi:hypothetical protein
MRYDLIAKSDAKGRWHWEADGPFPEQAGGPRIRESCCTPLGLACRGYGSEEEARESGLARLDELASEGVIDFD